MKKFFQDLFGSKDKKESNDKQQLPPPQQPGLSPQMEMEQLQMPMEQLQMPMSNMYQQRNDLFQYEEESKKDYDLTNDRIPVKPVITSKTTPPPISNPNDIIRLKLRSTYSKISKADYDSEETKIPLLVSVETDDVEDDDLRQGLDLVLVIDISTSMSGDKIHLVRETLTFILDELEPRDRVCMIKFCNECWQITGFKSMTKENKEKLKKVVDEEIVVQGSTDLRKAMKVAYSAMLSREEENDGTAVFLLSDGEDTCGNYHVNIKDEMEAGHKKMKERGFNYQTHSFGYGSDHDEKVLSMISDTTSGNFYYIKTNKHVDECFIDCFGYLMSVIASQVEITVKLSKGFKFNELYSISWKKKNDREALLKLHGLAVDKIVDYITELNLIKKEINFKSSESIKVASALLTYMYDDKKYSQEFEIVLTFVENEKEKGEPDPEVEENYSKALGAKIMEKAKNLCDAGKDDLATDEINKYHKRLKSKACLNGDFLQKMSKTVKMDFVREEKDFMQVNKMMCENAYNPAYDNFSKMNRKQVNLMSKKGKY